MGEAVAAAAVEYRSVVIHHASTAIVKLRLKDLPTLFLGHAASSSVEPQPRKKDIDPSRYQLVPNEYLQGINALIRDNSRETSGKQIGGNGAFRYMRICDNERRTWTRWVEAAQDANGLEKDGPGPVMVMVMVSST